MDYKLSKQIYGQAWLMDIFSLMSYSALLESIKSGSHEYDPENKLNEVSFLSESKFVSDLSDLRSSKEDFNGIGLVHINGPILYESSLSTKGMKEVSSEMLEMSKDARIKSFLVVGNSGGGATTGVECMLNAMKKIDQKIIGFIPYGGTACSAMAGILTGCDEIFSEHEMNVVGSFGTMIQTSGKASGSVDSNGNKTLRIYATKSTAKNKEFEEAINNDNYSLLVNDLLDPINERFLQMVVENRPALKTINFDDGHTRFAKDSIGSFIDGIKSFEEVVGLLKIENKIVNSKNNSKNNKKMTSQEIKNQYPEAYNEIFNAGIANEKDRVGAWLAHSETDLKRVKEGIKSGNPITQTDSQEMLVQATKANNLNNLKSDSPDIVETKETETDKVDVENEDKKDEVDSFYQDVKNNYIRN